MNRVFDLGEKFQIPDGTFAFPFLNPKDALRHDLPWDTLEAFSLAAVEIPARQTSKIHVMPHVTQVTFVLRHAVRLHMKDPDSDDRYTLALLPHQAALTRPGTFLQYDNSSPEACLVLCISSPAYLFEPGRSGPPVYDDSVMLDWTWEALKDRWHWKPPELDLPAVSSDARQAAYHRLAQRASRP